MNRRELLAAGAVASAPLLLGAAPAQAARDDQAAAISGLLAAELALQRAYERAAAGGPPALTRIAARFAAHEREHVGALAQALEALGAPELPVPPMPVGPAGLRELIALEEAAVARMTAVIADSVDGKLLQTVATIVACQAQHLVVLRAALP